jgi:TM2 domain-containing membrane protein YozV
MVSHVVCGRCGTLLDGPLAGCRTCGAVAATAVPRARKNRWLAAALAALVPGLGHIYLGQYPKGLVYMAGAGGLTFLGFDLDLTVIGAALGVPMELGALGLWAHGVWSAYQTGRQMELEDRLAQ